MSLTEMRTESTRRARWAATLLSVSLIAAACGTNQGGQGSPGAEGTGTGGTSPDAGSPDTSSPGAGAASGQLTAWAMGNEGVLLGDFVERYTEENPDAQVDVTPVDWGIARDRLLTAIGGNQTPDVSQMGTDMMGEFIETGALEPLPADIDPARFFEGAFNTGVTPDGTAYSVPWYVETRMLYYRTDIAEAAGI
ncbi:MAG: extracellular solute-binding protein, partial [Chloroflexota bacterium]|nr:extracellular solute-binding protein [Chloroflexota bacterium]